MLILEAIAGLDWGRCMQLVEQRVGLQYRSFDNRTLLHELVDADAPITLLTKVLMTGEVNLLEQTHQFGLTALHTAIQREGRCRVDVIKLLVDWSGGNELLRIATVHGSTPLFLACQLNCSRKVVEFLLQAGSDCNTQCYNGATPISICAEVNANPELVRVLVKHGADVNRPKFELFTTPLYVACELNASLDMIRTLCELGASCQSTAMEGSTPLHIAAQKNCPPQVMQLLIEFGGNVNQPKNVRVPALQNVSCELMEVILRLGGGEVNKSRLDGNTAMQVACENNCAVELVDLLVAAGGNLNRIGFDGQTCLIAATIRLAAPKLVGRILYYGADPSVTHIRAGKKAIDFAKTNLDVDAVRLIEKANLFVSLLSPRQKGGQRSNSLIVSFPLELMRKNLCSMLFSV
ncbi:hypothetical protein BASA81_012353 [Batrachochytrium salamandrivorans]|nr:hypothetical protein BASA81_012353 [Batrachochytrium salamandrivorans]